MQVYLALYAVKDNTRYFLLGFKKEYYNKESKRKGIKLHGAEKFCFPGGKLERGDSICSEQNVNLWKKQVVLLKMC